MNRKRIAIVGCGAIGSATAYTLMLECSNVEILLLNRSEKKSWAKAFDMSHTEPFLNNNIISSLKPDQCRNADIIIMTAGALPRENGTRADVLKDNVAIFKSVFPVIAGNNPNAVIINITNPVDSMAYAIQKITGFPEGRVIGTGTELDSMRIRGFIGKKYNLASDKINFNIIGEHGDSMVPLWSSASYDGRPLFEAVKDLDEDGKKEVLHKTKRAGWDIREAGEHSSYGISYSAVRIVKNIVENNEDSLLVSSPFNGEYGIEGLYMSQPSKVTFEGVVKREILKLSDDELLALEKSAGIMKDQMKMVDELL